METLKAKTVKSIWDECLSIIKDNVNVQSFLTWFEPIVPVKVASKELTIQVPSQFFYEWIEEHYAELLFKTIKRVLGPEGKLAYNIVVDQSNSLKDGGPYTINMPAQSPKSRNPEVHSAINLNGPNIKNPFIIPGLKKVTIDPQLSQSYTFDNFVEGTCNRLGRSAGLTIAARPGGTSFNPLVVYSPAGLGKTHLVQAIGNAIKEQHPNKTVLYVTSEKFANQYVDAVRNKSINDFMNFYQLLDVLIIDDVQFFASSSKENLQETFFQVFNDLHQKGKQLILTCDRSPKDLKGMADRLLSRFKWGLSAELHMPDLETRIKIMETKMAAKGIAVPEEVVEYVATHIVSNVREIEGALNSLLAHSLFNKSDINMELAREVMRNFIKAHQVEVSIESIKSMVCDYFEIAVDLLSEKTRKREVVQARQIAMYFAKQLTQNSLKNIGDAFGGRDHSTVIHSCQTVEDLMSTDRKFKSYIDEINKKIKITTHA